MRSLRCLVLISALACTGCYQWTTLVTVNGDGSGTIDQTIIATAAALAQMRQLAARDSSGMPFDPFSEDRARILAASLGANVTYVSSMPITNPTGEGRRILCAFTDVTQLRVSQQPAAPGGVKSPELDTTNPAGVRFALARQPDGNVLLRITMPDTKLPAIGAPAGEAPVGPLSAEQLALIKPVLAGAPWQSPSRWRVV